MGIVANNAVHHHQDSSFLHPASKLPERVRPGAVIGSPSVSEAQHIPHIEGEPLRLVIQGCRTDEAQRFASLFDQIFPHPGLAPLHHLDRLQEVGAGAVRTPFAEGAVMGDGKSLFRRFGKEEVSQGGRGGLREILKLKERRLDFAAQPLGELGKPPLKESPIARALQRPHKDGTTNRDSSHTARSLIIKPSTFRFVIVDSARQIAQIAGSMMRTSLASLMTIDSYIP